MVLEDFYWGFRLFGCFFRGFLDGFLDGFYKGSTKGPIRVCMKIL